MKNKIIIPVLTLVVSFTSCYQEEAQPSASELLSGKLWRVVSANADLDGDGNFEYQIFPDADPNVTPSCDMDDWWEFVEGGSLCFHTRYNHCWFDEPGLLCGAAWQLSSDGKHISTWKTADQGYYPPHEMDIVLLTDYQFQFTFYAQASFGPLPVKVQMTPP